MKAARLNRKMRSSNLKEIKTKTGNSRISLKLPQSFIRMQKALWKGTRWSKTMLLRDSQQRRRVVLKQRWSTEANWRVIIRLPATTRGKSYGRLTKQLLATKRRKILLSFLQHPSNTKDLIPENPYSHGMCKKGTTIPRVAPKIKKSLQDSNPVTKKEVDKGRLFVQGYFQLHSNFNDIVSYTLSSGFSGSGLIPIVGIPLFLFDLSRWMLRTA